MNFLFYTALFLYTATLSAIYANIDYDFWARLIVGKIFFQTGTVLNYDFLSYTPTHPWIDHEWGSSLVFYFIQDRFGDFGLFILKTVLTFLTYFILIEVIKLRRKFKNPNQSFDIFNILFFIFTIQAAAVLVFATVRCQIFTFFFFALWLYVLEKTRLTRNYKLLWMLPVSMIIWANLHGGCFIGLVLLGIYTVGEYLNGKKYAPYILSIIFSLIACAISPYGIKYLEFLFMATTMKRENITEWQGLFTSMHSSNFYKFKYYALILSTAVSIYIIRQFNAIKDAAFIQKIKIYYKKADKTKVLIILAMLFLSIKSIRMIPFFTFVSIAFLYDDYYKVLNRKLPDALNKIKEIILYTLILITFLSTVVFRPIEYKTVQENYPIHEVDYIKTNQIKGNVLVNFHYGSYVAYKLYPNNHIFMDGRYEEVYYDDLIGLLRKIHIGKDWKKNLNKYHTDIIIIEKSYIIYPLLLKDADWIKVEESKEFALFLPKEKYKTNKYTLPLREKDFYNKTKWNSDISWSIK